jgi:c-di-GMP-binding flagellar brake protein YcgR
LASLLGEYSFVKVMPMKERRKYERLQLKLPARLEINSLQRAEMFELQTRDISAAGVLLLGTTAQFAVGTHCHLELIVSSERIKELTGVQGLIKIEGTVVRSTPDGVAICFDGDCQILGLKGS